MFISLSACLAKQLSQPCKATGGSPKIENRGYRRSGWEGFSSFSRFCYFVGGVISSPSHCTGFGHSVLSATVYLPFCELHCECDSHLPGRCMCPSFLTSKKEKKT